MIGTARASSAHPPRTKVGALLAIAYAGILTVASVTELFFFEDINAFFDNRHEYTLGLAVIVSIQIFALPFLLQMSLSKAFRVLSALCTCSTPLIMYLAAIFSPVSIGAPVILILAVVFVIVSVYSLWPSLRYSRKNR